MSQPALPSLFANLSATLAALEEHAATIAVMIGHFEELNATAGRNDFSEGGKRGAAAIRNTVLRHVLIASCASFALAKRPDDISFRRYDEALADPTFVDYCAKSTGRYVGSVRTHAAEFRKLFSNALPHYNAVKAMRDKSIAHLTRKPFASPVIDEVLGLGRASVSMAECLTYVNGGSDVTISTLYGIGKSHVRALRRAEQPKS